MSKYLSRKFLMALLSVVAGLLTMFNVEDSIVQLITSIGLIIVPTLVYIGVEGKIDYERILIAALEVNRKLQDHRTEEEQPEVVEAEVVEEEEFIPEVTD